MIDVILPVYNPGTYLAPALQSVLNQEGVDFTVYVVDDQSDEPVEDIVRELADPRIRFSRNPKRLGIGGNWNVGARLGKAPFLTVFHQDDLMHTGNLSLKANVLDEHPNVAFVFSRSVVLDAQAHPLDELRFTEWVGGKYITGDDFIQTMLYARDMLVCCPSVMMRRSSFNAVGGFDERYGFTLDLDMWLRLASVGDAYYMDEALLSHRRHERQASAGFRNINGLLEEYAVKRRALTRWESIETAVAIKDLKARYITRIFRLADECADPRAWLFPALKGILSVDGRSLFSRDALRLFVRSLRHKEEMS